MSIIRVVACDNHPDRPNDPPAAAGKIIYQEGDRPAARRDACAACLAIVASMPMFGGAAKKKSATRLQGRDFALAAAQVERLLRRAPKGISGPALCAQAGIGSAQLYRILENIKGVKKTGARNKTLWSLRKGE